MDCDGIFREIRNLPFGKSLHESKYIHRDGLATTSTGFQDFIAGLLETLNLKAFPFNLLKFSFNGYRLSLLNYPTFWTEDFPALKESCSIEVATHTTRFSSYQDSPNPPILHRKETFLPKNHPRFEEFARTTRLAEEAGLFEGCNRIGFRNDWLEHIQGFGYTIRNGVLCLFEEAANQIPSEDAVIFRHRTAIDRYSFSNPVQALLQHGFLGGPHSFLDYGCGKGDDVRELKARGLQASGWDPFFYKETTLEPADVVNLGFVINVIEEFRERAETLNQRWKKMPLPFVPASFSFFNRKMTNKNSWKSASGEWLIGRIKPANRSVSPPQMGMTPGSAEPEKSRRTPI